MKIDEPKTPYAKHYDPMEDPSDNEEDVKMDQVSHESGSASASASGASTSLDNSKGNMDHHRAGRKAPRPGREDDIPGLSLGEPEEEIPEATAQRAQTGGRGSTQATGAVGPPATTETDSISTSHHTRDRSGSGSGSGSEKQVHVDDEGVGHSAEDDLAALSPEEREKHLQFEAARKKHYEMGNVAQLLAHPEALPDEDEDSEDEAMPTVPSLPNGNN